jgi:hypothetical protein
MKKEGPSGEARAGKKQSLGKSIKNLSGIQSQARQNTFSRSQRIAIGSRKPAITLPSLKSTGAAHD